MPPAPPLNLYEFVLQLVEQLRMILVAFAPYLPTVGVAIVGYLGIKYTAKNARKISEEQMQHAKDLAKEADDRARRVEDQRHVKEFLIELSTADKFCSDKAAAKNGKEYPDCPSFDNMRNLAVLYFPQLVIPARAYHSAYLELFSTFPWDKNDVDHIWKNVSLMNVRFFIERRLAVMAQQKDISADFRTPEERQADRVYFENFLDKFGGLFGLDRD